MKRMRIGLLLISLLGVFMTGCSDQASQTANESMQNQSSIEQGTDNSTSNPTEASQSPVNNLSDAAVNEEEAVDLTALSSTMIYSEVYNMMAAPEDYMGRTVKMKGQFAVYQDKEKNKNYYAVLIADATACCQQGLEFVLGDEYQYPDDYPADGTEITVTGTFETYEEDGNKYCQLIDANMTIDE